MTSEEALLALKLVLNSARESGATQKQIEDVIYDYIWTTNIADIETPQTPIENKIEETIPIIKEENPTVIECNTEIATFSDGTTVMRQRCYLNSRFAYLRPRHSILPADTFRVVFQEGTLLSDAQKRFAFPDEIQVDGDPGDAKGRMLRP